jgi:hypothetical protein
LLKRFLKDFANALHQYKRESQAGINFQIKQFKLRREGAEIGTDTPRKFWTRRYHCRIKRRSRSALKEIALSRKGADDDNSRPAR